MMIPFFTLIKLDPFERFNLLAMDLMYHKFERDNQGSDDPRILFRNHDQRGFVESAIINPVHKTEAIL